MREVLCEREDNRAPPLAFPDSGTGETVFLLESDEDDDLGGEAEIDTKEMGGSIGEEDTTNDWDAPLIIPAAHNADDASSVGDMPLPPPLPEAEDLIDLSSSPTHLPSKMAADKSRNLEELMMNKMKLYDMEAMHYQGTHGPLDDLQQGCWQHSPLAAPKPWPNGHASASTEDRTKTARERRQNHQTDVKIQMEQIPATTGVHVENHFHNHPSGADGGWFRLSALHLWKTGSFLLPLLALILTWAWLWLSQSAALPASDPAPPPLVPSGDVGLAPEPGDAPLPENMTSCVETTPSESTGWDETLKVVTMMGNALDMVNLLGRTAAMFEAAAP